MLNIAIDIRQSSIQCITEISPDEFFLGERRLPGPGAETQTDHGKHQACHMTERDLAVTSLDLYLMNA